MFNKAKEFLILMDQFEDNKSILINRQDFHSEELMGEGELIEALLDRNRLLTADGLADVAYVVTGTGALLGMTGSPVKLEEMETMSEAECLGWLCAQIINLPMSGNPEQSIQRIMSFLYRLAELNQVDLDVAFDIAHENNMSKVCTTEEDVSASLSHYGFPINVIEKETAQGTVYVLRSATNTNIKYFHGKVLKPVSWIEPDFTPSLTSLG